MDEKIIASGQWHLARERRAIVSIVRVPSTLTELLLRYFKVGERNGGGVDWMTALPGVYHVSRALSYHYRGGSSLFDGSMDAWTPHMHLNP